jgi:hypothetical protein
MIGLHISTADPKISEYGICDRGSFVEQHQESDGQQRDPLVDI